jgi:hypothetical protein
MVRTHFSQRQQLGSAGSEETQTRSRPKVGGQPPIAAVFITRVASAPSWTTSSAPWRGADQSGVGAPGDEVALGMARGHVEASHAAAERERAPDHGAPVEESPVPAGHERLDVGARGHELNPEAR